MLDRGERNPLRMVLIVLLGLLASLFVFAPFFTESIFVTHAVRLVIEVMFVVTAWVATSSRPLVGFLALVAVLNEITVRMAQADPNPLTVLADLSFDFVFIGSVVWILGSMAWRVQRVGAETLLGAIAVYFMLGYLWATAFSILEYSVPGSFANVCESGRCIQELGRFPRLTYFSFVTMTTLGYGDILPKTPRAEGLATLCAVTGQLFLAVLIGRLVSDYLVHRGDESD